MKRIVFCAALPNELKAFCREWGMPVPSKKVPVRESVSSDISVTVCVSGMGREKMQNRLDSIQIDSASCWVSVGFAGALKNEYAVGDCLEGNAVCLPSGETLDADPPSFLHESALSRRLVCVDEIVASDTEKRELFDRTQADAVDMESAAVAEHARSRAEPFAWIRVISDSLTDDMPRELAGCIGEDGFPSPFSALRVLAFKPALWPTVIRLGLQSHRLSTYLAKVMQNFLSP